jgi:hypothetical protein
MSQTVSIYFHLGMKIENFTQSWDKNYFNLKALTIIHFNKDVSISTIKITLWTLILM